MIARLFPLTDDDPFLHPKEIAERVAHQFTRSIVDWDRANARLQSELSKLEESGAPDPIIAGHKNLFSSTVYIEVRHPDDSRVGVCFFVYLDSPIEVEATKPDVCGEAELQESLVAKIAKCLEYDVEFAT